MASSMPGSSGMGNNNMRKTDRRDGNDRGNSMQRGGSMSGSGYNNSNKLNRNPYQDNDGWIQQGGNKSRGGNNPTPSYDPSKFRASSVSVAGFEPIEYSFLRRHKQFTYIFFPFQSINLFIVEY